MAADRLPVRADIALVGGGIVGLATAYQLAQRDPRLRACVLEKEADLAAHQTGRNSGVLHSGVYYRPGSLKAVTCRAGKALMEAFCGAEGVPFERCGKVIVATTEAERPALHELNRRAAANGVRCELIGPGRLREREPFVAGVEALDVPETGIVDYVQVCRRLAESIRTVGGAVVTGARVTGIRERTDRVVVRSSAGDLAARVAVNCAGLHCDRVARRAGQRPAAQIVPFRGEYYDLKPAARRLCRGLIYPVPDPRFPFLGVHFTRRVGGGVECGPNAVLAFKREGYRLRDVDLRDLAETLAYPGFRRLARRYWRMGLGEFWRSVSKRAFVTALRRLVPDVTADDLVPAPAGVRAQAVAADGQLVDDFLIQESGRVIHVLNAPSPAATASLAIGQHVADRVIARLA